MKTIKTSIEKTENGILLYQLNKYGHQRIFLSDDDIQTINRLHKSHGTDRPTGDDPDYDEYKDDPAYAEYQHIKAQWANRPEASQ